MAHGVLNTEHLQDIAVSICPIDVSAGTWNVLTGATIALSLDEFEDTFTEEQYVVNSGQQNQRNRRSSTTDYSINMVIKAQKDDYDTGKLGDMLLNYKFFRIFVFEGGQSFSYDVLKTNRSRNYGEQAGLIRFSGEQAYP